MLAGSLVGALVALLVSRDPIDASTWVLFAILPVWHWGGLAAAYRISPSWEEVQWPRIAVIAGDITLWFILVTGNPAFYFVLFGLYGQVFRHIRTRYAAVASAAITIMSVVRETVLRGEPVSFRDPSLLALVGTGIVGITIGLYISSIVRQSGERQELIQKLESSRADLAEAAHREAVLEERERLAREIHDTLAQGFTSIVIHLETALSEMERLPDAPGRERVQVAADTARRNLAEARRVVRDLRPDILETTSLVQAIKRTAARWTSEHGIPTTVDVAGTPIELGGDREVALYRAVEESLANVLKHARASSVDIGLQFADGSVTLTVTDDGDGIGSRPDANPAGYGILGMRERAEALGGSVRVSSSLGPGTTVHVALPRMEHA